MVTTIIADDATNVTILTWLAGAYGRKQGSGQPVYQQADSGTLKRSVLFQDRGRPALPVVCRKRADMEQLRDVTEENRSAGHKKDKNIQIANEIGKQFREHNIMEYKSPEDQLNIDTFYKSGAYASLYKAYGETVDGRTADDITVSIVRQSRPVKLFRYFEEHGIRVENPYNGIYYVLDAVLFPTQIVVTKELDRKNHMWLSALSEGMGKQDMKELLERIDSLTQKQDRELADSVLEVSVRANRRIVEELRGDGNMCQALLEIMEPEINEIRESEVLRGKIIGTVETLREFGQSDDEIKRNLIKKYHLSVEETKKYL